MCTVPLPPGDNQIAVNKYININKHRPLSHVGTAALFPRSVFMFLISFRTHSHCFPRTLTRRPTYWTHKLCFLWDTDSIAIYLTRG